MSILTFRSQLRKKPKGRQELGRTEEGGRILHCPVGSPAFHASSSFLISGFSVTLQTLLNECYFPAVLWPLKFALLLNENVETGPEITDINLHGPRAVRASSDSGTWLLCCVDDSEEEKFPEALLGVPSAP